MAAEATVGEKGLGEYLVSLLSSPSEAQSLLRQTTAFGWAPAHAFLLDSAGAPTFEPAADAADANQPERIRVEAGGGSGAGFQLFCGGVLLLSAGGGGGGGIEGRAPGLEGPGMDFSIGGGGGGGALGWFGFWVWVCRWAAVCRRKGIGLIRGTTLAQSTICTHTYTSTTN